MKPVDNTNNGSMMIDGTDKPKLLLIAGYFPPVRISCGSIRPWNLAINLIKIGWDVTVVTPKISVWDKKHLDDPEGVNEEIEKHGIKMIYTEHAGRFLAPWRYNHPSGKLYWFFGGILRRMTKLLGIQNWIGWVPSALRACKDLEPQQVDVILATGAPFWGFEIAYQLSKKLKKPYIVDYRDLWTDNPWNRVSHKWVSKHEKKLLDHCEAITIVSPISGDVLAKKYAVANKIRVITNGYGTNDVENALTTKTDHFSIIFAGSLISAKMTLSSLFKVLKSIAKRNDTPDWKFHYFGPNVEEMRKEVHDFDLENKSTIHGNLPRKDVLGREKGASLNIVMSSDADSRSTEDLGVIPGKIFELIGLDANILPIVPKNSAIEIILGNLGVKSFSHGESDQIEEFIVDCMFGRQNRGVGKEKYSWEVLSREFDQVLKLVISKRQTNG